MNSQEEKDLIDAMEYIKNIQQGENPKDLESPLVVLNKLLRSIEFIYRNEEGQEVIISIITPTGEEQINILEDCGYVFYHINSIIFKELSPKKIDEYLNISTPFLSSRYIPIKLKIQLMDSENSFASDAIFSFLPSYSNCTDAVISRYSIGKEGLSNKEPDIFNEDKKNIEIGLSKYVSAWVEYFVNNGKLLQAVNALNELLNKAVSDEEKKTLISSLVHHSTSFNLISKSELNSLIDEYEELFSKDDLDFLKGNINQTPGGILVKDFRFSQGNLSLKSTRNKNIATLIQFSIPYKCNNKEPYRIVFNESLSIVLLPVYSFWSDPIFKVMRTTKIANMGWSYFCDVEPEHGSDYTHVQIIADYLFTPDVTLKEDTVENINFSEKEALIGRLYDPHKEFVIQLFRDNYELLANNININKESVNINFFSSYFVAHVNKDNGELIHRKIFAITNPESFSIATSRFTDRLTSVNLSDSLISIKSLLTDIKIETEKNLTEFIYRAMDVCVKHNIEQHGGYKYFWKTNNTGKLTPCSEPESQPYIFSHLRAVCDFMGIQISREAQSSNGEIDFLVTYTNSSNNLLRICVELKLAHASNVENGITLQLPAYMTGERCRYGIYVVLWYKNGDFDDPKKYKSIQDLKDKLDAINTNKKILNMIIDCTKPISPSKLKH